MTKHTPATPSPDVQAMAIDWPMITALLGGTRAMRDAGEAYLPKHPAEAPEGYNYRKSVSTLFNGFRRTVNTLSSKPFSDPLKLGDDVPPQLVEYCENIDLAGRDLQAFAHDAFRVAMAYGLTHILVDYPKTEPGQTLDDQRKSAVRPYFVHVSPQSVLGWRAERVNGVETLTQLRLDEYVSEPDGEWGTRKVRQIRVLEPNKFTLYRKNDKDEWVMFEEGPVSIGIIPLVTIYCERTDFMTARPPLLDLADLNVEHWQSSSDQSNILHVARVPILFAAGFGDGSIAVGAGIAVKNDDPASKLSYVEHSGAAIEAGRQSIKDLEDRMSLMGAQLLVRKQVAATATEKRLDSSDADSALSMMAIGLEDSLELALSYVAKWDGIECKCTVEVVSQFDDPLDSMSAEELMSAKKFGVLSSETVFAELQRRGVVSEENTWEEEAARLKKEGPPAGIKGNFEAPTV